jgi:hypothetical protein
MGAIQSINYPGDYPQKISPNNMPEISVVNSRTSLNGRPNSVTLIDRGDIKIVEKHFENQIDLLRSYLNLYQLFDGYDSKNSIVLKDLEKKLINQKKELKLLYETRDKLHSNLDYSKLKFEEHKTKKKNFTILITLFAITFFVILFFIVNELRYYLLEDYNNINNLLN